MPYNTRRKSLSLPSLGIHLPQTSRAHRSPPLNKEPASADLPFPPAKRVKHSHHDPEIPNSPPASHGSSPVENKDARPISRRSAIDHTPPPSPRAISPATKTTKVDTDGINDDIVIAVILQLEKTGNRPHLIKDLATVLAATNESVAKYGFRDMRPLLNANETLHSSANPAALLSSRLSLYLKRPWTALAPCPLAKELIPVHPRKVFFYLTTCPRQELPDNSDDIITPTTGIKQLTPSISTPSIDQDDIDAETRARERMSPSPEIDLSNPELEDDSVEDAESPPTPAGSFSARSSLARDGSTATAGRLRRNRAPSPPLEADEKGFTEMANAVRARAMSLNNDDTVRPSTETADGQSRTDGPAESTSETAEQTSRRDQELGFELFGQQDNGAITHPTAMIASSPMIAPQKLSTHVEVKKEYHLSNSSSATLNATSVSVDVDFKDIEMMNTSTWDMQSPEDVEIGELDGLFSGF